MILRALGIAVLGLVAASATRAGEPKASEPLPTADQVIERFVAAVGGADAIRALQTRSCEGTLTHDLRSRTPPVYAEIPFKACAKLPDRKLFVEHDPGDHIRTGFDGTTGWREKSGKASEAPDEGRSKMSWLLNPQNALRISDYFPDLTCVGVKELRGHRCYQLVPKDRDPLYYTLHFDADSGLLFSLGHYWEFQEWKEVDGVLFPHRIVCGRKGGSSTYEFTAVSHNESLDDQIFAMPGK